MIHNITNSNLQEIVEALNDSGHPDLALSLQERFAEGMKRIHITGDGSINSVIEVMKAEIWFKTLTPEQIKELRVYPDNGLGNSKFDLDF